MRSIVFGLSATPFGSPVPVVMPPAHSKWCRRTVL